MLENCLNWTLEPCIKLKESSRPLTGLKHLKKSPCFNQTALLDAYFIPFNFSVRIWHLWPNKADDGGRCSCIEWIKHCAVKAATTRPLFDWVTCPLLVGQREQTCEWRTDTGIILRAACHSLVRFSFYMKEFSRRRYREQQRLISTLAVWIFFILRTPGKFHIYTQCCWVVLT